MYEKYREKREKERLRRREREGEKGRERLREGNERERRQEGGREREVTVPGRWPGFLTQSGLNMERLG